MQTAGISLSHWLLEYIYLTTIWYFPETTVYIEFNTLKRTGAGKNNGQNEKEQFNNAAYGKTMKKLRNKVNVRVVNNKYDYFKWHQNQVT